MRQRLLILICVLGLALGVVFPAFGHAVLERSQPAVNSSVATSPRQIALWFSETVTPTFNTIAVQDRDGKTVGLGEVRVSGDQRGLIATFPDLPRGVYTVRWRVLSATDGHTTSGFFLFAVGQPMPSGLAPATQEPAQPAAVAVRWIGILSTLLLAGTAFFPVAILKPALAKADHSFVQGIVGEVAGHLRTLTIMAGIVLIVAGAVEFLLQAATLLDTSVRQLIAQGMFWSFLWGAKPGWSLLLRTSMTLILLFPSSPRGRILRMVTLIWVVLITGLISVLGGPPAFSSLHMSVIVLISSVYGLIGMLAARIAPDIVGVRVPEFPWAEPLAAAGVLAGITITAHASGSGLLAIQADWLHLVAASLWAGGLTCLVVILRKAAPAGRGQLAHLLVPQFSTVAGGSVIVLVITGLYGVWLHVPAVQAFVLTTYGQALGLKLLLVTLVLILGAFNRFVLVPRIKSPSPGNAVRELLRSTGGELASAAAVVLAVAVFTSVPPANATFPSTARKPLALAGVAGGMRVNFAVTPAAAGWNRFEVEVSSPDRNPLASDARVLVRWTKLDEELDSIVIQPDLQSPGRYMAEGSQLALPGWWEAEVVVRRRGQEDVSTRFPLRLGPVRPVPTTPAAQQLLDEVRSAVGALHAWREIQQITDGNGGMVITRFDVVAPDRVHYQTSDGSEAVIVGTVRALRSGAEGWVRDTLPRPVVADGPLSYLRDARSVVLGRNAPCEQEPCQVFLWQWDQTTSFAAWIGTRTHRVLRVLMVAPEHYMTLEYRDYNAPIQVELPR